MYEYFTSKSNVHGTFWNLHIKINLKICILGTNGPIEFKFCMLFSKSRLCSIKIIKSWQLLWQFKIQQNSVPVALKKYWQTYLHNNSNLFKLCANIKTKSLHFLRGLPRFGECFLFILSVTRLQISLLRVVMYTHLVATS